MTAILDPQLLGNDLRQPGALEIRSLNKAYQQGYMAGLTGQPQHQQPYPAEVLAAAWEAGWDDGNEQFALHKRRSA